MEDLIQLADLIKAKNAIENIIARLIGRPALMGHVGEYIASMIFDIQLEQSAVQKSIDGYFQSGQLAGRSVNIKWYGKQEGILDITPITLPDYYLVLSGPISPAISSRGRTRPWSIDHVYLFPSAELVGNLRLRHVKIGIATSVAKAYWEAAEIYPEQRNNELEINEQARSLLTLFSGGRPVM